MSNKKQIFKMNTLKKLLNDENSCVKLVPTTRLLALPPFFLNDMKSGILYLLNNMLKKYDRSLGGIVIGYQNIKVLMDENTGIIPIGTSETEVNISVEFYIFQPKIGSFLEGVINKKSNSHIGCLVHRYFNATILKPEDVNYDEWICQDYNVDDKIIFKVKDLDFTTLLPLIEGVIDDGRLLDRVKTNGKCNLSNDIVNNVNESEVSSSKKVSENNRKIKNVSTLKHNIDNNSHEFQSFTDLKSKKKKKKDKEALNSSDSQSQREKEDLSDRALIPDTLIKDFKADEGNYVKKKKKRDKKLQEEEEVVKNTQGFLSNEVSSNFSSNDKSKDNKIKSNKSVKNLLNKVKKEKRKKQIELEECFESNTTNEGLLLNDAEDDIFYSTQLDPSLPKKMKICCSPISKDAQNTNYDKDKGQFQNSAKEICKKEIEDNRENCKKSDMDCTKEFKRKKVKLPKEENGIVNLSKNKKSKINGESRKENNSDTNRLIDELLKQEINRVKRELNISEKESCEKVKKEKIKKKKNENLGESTDETVGCSKKIKINGNNENSEKDSMQDMIDQLLKQELNRVKEEFRKSDSKSSKKEKKVVNKEKESSKEKSQNSLYEKLLKEAKNSLGLEAGGKFSKSPFAKDSGKKKKKALLNVTCSSKIRDSIEKSDQSSQFY